MVWRLGDNSLVVFLRCYWFDDGAPITRAHTHSRFSVGRSIVLGVHLLNLRPGQKAMESNSRVLCQWDLVGCGRRHDDLAASSRLLLLDAATVDSR